MQHGLDHNVATASSHRRAAGNWVLLPVGERVNAIQLALAATTTTQHVGWHQHIALRHLQASNMQ
jgi:predicted hotdog family 3-hydroxylacyl-ACP dehydratase